MTEGIVRRTQSLCPICRKPLAAAYRQREDGIYLQRHCPEHGAFLSLAWRGGGFEEWIGDIPEAQPDPDCPQRCGICAQHHSATCCVLLEVTARCNLACRFCFAAEVQEPDPDLAQIEAWLDDLVVPGQTLLQLSGGEPTLRDDLPQIVAAAKRAGCRHIQLNTNGLRLAEDESYVRALAEAGLSFVFLQFDGCDDSIYEQLRGRELLALKHRAIAHCDRYQLGVTLVPTLVPGINTEQIGAILDYAIRQSPAVRGVHFQPVCHMGRTPRDPITVERFTLDMLMDSLVEQSAQRIRRAQLLPSSCDHPLCGFHSDFVVMPDFSLHPLSQERSPAACCTPRPASTAPGTEACCCAPSARMDRDEAAARNRRFVSRRWQRAADRRENAAADIDLSDMDQFLQRLRSHGFTVTAMAFQDSGHLDLDRLRRCSLHIYKDGRHIPFCSYYL